ncbi:MAG: hypothetical protein ACRC92_12695 [Peptostreptococcaceae bacterium]
MISRAKSITLAIIFILCSNIFVGCTVIDSENETVIKSLSLGSNIKNQEITPIILEEIEFVNGRIERYSEDYRAIEVQIKNNSNLTITEAYFNFKLDNGNTSVLGFYETLKPGETSTKKECEASTSGKIKDIIFNNAIIRAVDGVNEVQITYDAELNKYTVEREKINKWITPDVLISDIELINPELKDIDSRGIRYFEVKLKNNSKKTITSIVISYDIGNGETSTLSTYETLPPGNTSSKEICIGPEEGTIEDMKINTISITALKNKDKEVNIEYDAKLGQYHINE